MQRCLMKTIEVLCLHISSIENTPPTKTKNPNKISGRSTKAINVFSTREITFALDLPHREVGVGTEGERRGVRREHQV